MRDDEGSKQPAVTVGKLRCLDSVTAKLGLGGSDVALL